MLNLTPHPIVLIGPDGRETVIPPSGTVARVTTTEEVVATAAGLPVVARRFGAVTGLPDDGEPVIVSALVLSAVPGRAGVYAPDTGATARRNADGQVTGVTRLVQA